MFVNTRLAVIKMIEESRLPISRVADLVGMTPHSIFRLKRDPNSKCRSYNVEKIADICGFKIKWDQKRPDECNVLKNDEEPIEEIQNMNGFTNEIEKLADRIADYKMESRMKDAEIEQLKQKIDSINIDADDKDFIKMDKFHSCCKMEVRIKGLTLESRLLEVTGKDSCFKFLGYTVPELEEMWDTDVWYKSDEHPINSLINKESPTKWENAKAFVRGALTIAKTAFMQNEKFALPVIYTHKDGSKVQTTLYFEFNISEKIATIKTRFHNGSE